jgi:aldehyde dehydrogenase (NAD+)
MTPDQPWRSYIAGQWVGADGASRYETIDPGRPTSTVGRYLLATADDVERAVAVAGNAAEKWSAVPAPERGELIHALIDRWRDRAEEVAEVVTREMGKPLGEARGEAARAIGEMRFWAGEATRLGDRSFPSARSNTEAYTIREPIGPVAAITPWNFPILTPLRKVIPALVCGCPVVLKPAPQAPGPSVLITEMLDEVGVPAGVLGLLLGGGDIGSALVGHPGIAGVSFTGSTDVGLRIATAAAERNAKVQLEMGGKNPAVVASCDDPGGAAAEIAAAAFAVAGQRCTAISRVIVLEDERDALEQALVERAEALVVGHGMEPETTLGPLVSREQFEKVREYVSAAAGDGARILTGGAPPEADGEEGYYFPPTVVTDVAPGTPLATEEVFGPVLAVMPVGSFDEAVAVSNETRYGLTASIFTADMDLAHAFIRRSDTGMVHVNHGTTSEGHLPFGGVKQSGQGAYGIGDTSKDFFTQLKAVYHVYRG